MSIALVALIAASISLTIGSVRSAFVTFCFATVSIFLLSPLQLSSNIPIALILMLLVAYGTFAIAVAKWLQRGGYLQRNRTG